jgi:signal transduction histidine kinase
LESVLKECLAMMEIEIERTNAQIEIEQPLPTFKANRTLLVQIFSNLLSNAVKFVRKGETPNVKIYAHQAGDTCEVHVKDMGTGIAEQFQQSVFKMFERGNADRQTTGTGIGLAVVKRAVERLGGKVSVKSTVGEGSDFVVHLPCEWPVACLEGKR